MKIALRLDQYADQLLLGGRTISNAIEPLVQGLLSDLDLKARSLLVSVWGDSVAPHGGTVWLGSLIDLVACFGLNERAVRTSVFRLKNEKMLSSSQQGRKSYYTLTGSGQRRFEEATKRIYKHTADPWDGSWTLLFTERRKMDDAVKKQLFDELHWLGYGDLGSGILAHPRGNAEDVNDLTQDLEITGLVAVMKAASLPSTEETPSHILIRKGWNLEEIESGYLQFSDHFKPVLNALQSGATYSDETAFMLRTLMVHDYRRALLKDPMLPDSLLPETWGGGDARQIFRDIYQMIWQAAERYLLEKLQSEKGDLPELSKEFMMRFGGLT
ncbi:MAG: phenylacetic acid degradation operon negative regulatory protein PaaX [Sneathiella sp.]|nr:phenylacetic acid degradation operon negative regulatory protein PaaX [Sneathiella sp.]